MNMTVQYFRDSKPGPELEIEKIVTNKIPQLFPHNPEDEFFWTGSSVPIGSSLPDLLIAVCEPKIFSLSKLKITPTNILSYLRAVGNVKLETISKRIGESEKIILKYITDLIDLEIVDTCNNTYFLRPEWRNIISDIISIEVKVSNWRKVIDQALRNSIYCHRSYVAIPEKILIKLCNNPHIKAYGVGILSIRKDGNVIVVKNARKSKPTVWSYYYKIASLIAQKN